MLLPITILMTTMLAAGPANGSDAATRYRIVYSAERPRLVHVEAEFTVRGDTLRMYGFGGEHLPDAWRTFVHDERLLDAAGRELPLERLPERKWRFVAEPGQRLRLTYDVAIEHDRGRWIPDAREAAYVREWGAFAVGRALFVYPDVAARDIEISFGLPAGWSVETAWTRADADTFRAENWNEVINSIVFAGRFTSFDVAEGAVTVSFALGGPGFETSREPMTAVARDLLRAYARLFGGAPAARLLVVVNPDPDVMGGGGGVFGRSISMTFDSPPSRETTYAWGHTLAHELFHVWNSSALQRGSASEEWLVEGNADYYAVLTMTRLGYFPVPVLLRKLGRAIANYERVAGQISLAQAGYQEWQEPGPTMLYSGGWTAALALDLAIRRATSDRKSLDDVLHDLYARLGNAARPLTNAELLGTVNRTAGLDFASFFRRHVDGTQRLSVAEYLQHVGLELGEDGQLRLARSPSADQLRSRSAYLGPRAQSGD